MKLKKPHMRISAPGGEGPYRRNTRKRSARKDKLNTILHQLADQAEDPAVVLELYYWSREPDLARLMCMFVQLTETTRKILSAFMEMAEDDPESVEACVRANGEIVLSSALVSELFKKLTHTESVLDQAGSLH